MLFRSPFLPRSRAQLDRGLGTPLDDLTSADTLSIASALTNSFQHLSEGSVISWPPSALSQRCWPSNARQQHLSSRHLDHQLTRNLSPAPPPRPDLSLQRPPSRPRPHLLQPPPPSPPSPPSLKWITTRCALTSLRSYKAPRMLEDAFGSA